MAGLLAAVAVIAVIALSVAWLVGRRPARLGEQPPAEKVTAPAPASRPSPAGRSHPSCGTAACDQGDVPQHGQRRYPPRLDSRSSEGITVLVRTSPADANVVFDSNQSLACKSPCSLSLPPGRHTASATLPGYRTALRIFQLPGEAELYLYMARMSGQVQVLSTPQGASIFVDGQPRAASTPATLELAAGKYVIAVVKEGYRRDEQDVEIKDSAFVRLNFSLGKIIHIGKAPKHAGPALLLRPVLPLLGQSEFQVVACSYEVGPEAQGLRVFSDRFIDPPLSDQRISQAVVNLGGVGA